MSLRHVQSHFPVLLLGCVPSKAVPSLRANYKFYKIKIILCSLDLWGTKPKINHTTRLQLNITIFTGKDVNLDSEVYERHQLFLLLLNSNRIAESSLLLDFKYHLQALEEEWD